MRIILLILIYALCGIAFAAWTNAEEKTPESFYDRDDEKIWVLLCIPFWVFIGIGYMIMALFDRLTAIFKRGEEDG